MLFRSLKDLARRSALSLKAAAGEIIVVESINFEAPKTKEYINFAKNLKVDGKKVLVVLSEKNNNVHLSMRNVPDARLMTASDINTYAVLNHNALILSEDSVAVLNNI